MSEEYEPHDSARMYSSLKKHHWFDVGSKIALSEKDPGKRNWMLIFLMVMCVFAGIFGVGYAIEYTVLAPPTQVIGVCPPPAFIATDNNCYQVVYHTNTAGQIQSQTIQAGTIIGNGTGP